MYQNTGHDHKQLHSLLTQIHFTTVARPDQNWGWKKGVKRRADGYEEETDEQKVKPNHLCTSRAWVHEAPPLSAIESKYGRN